MCRHSWKRTQCEVLQQGRSLDSPYAVRLSRSDPRNSMSVTAHFLRPFGLVLRFYEAWAFRTTKIFKYILNTGECIYALFFDYLVRESTSVSSKNMNVNLMNNFH